MGSVPLGAGMQASAEILLGRRTVMEYLLSPVQKAFHEAGGNLPEFSGDVVVTAATPWLNIRFSHVSLHRYITGKFSQTCR
ncbi:MAG: hypothetical protein ACYC05_02115 [Sulfuricella sp.]